MPRLFRLLFAPILLVAGCAMPAPIVGALPAPAPGTAQIVFYRDVGYYDPANVLTIALNNRNVAVLPRGEVVYRDVPPGTYTVTFNPTRTYPNQFKTVTVAAGEVAYIKLEGLPDTDCSGTIGTFGGCDISGYTSVAIDPVQARREIQGLPLVQG